MGRFIALMAAGALVASLATPAFPEEQLANPFGGYPPDYSPDIPENADIVSENWTGNVLGYKREISVIAYEENGRYHESLSTISSSRSGENCFIEPTVVQFDAQRFVTKPAVGGCWKTRTQNSHTEFLRDLGGVRYGSFNCTRNLSTLRGTCVYTSASTGKKHEFQIRGTVNRW